MLDGVGVYPKLRLSFCFHRHCFHWSKLLEVSELHQCHLYVSLSFVDMLKFRCPSNDVGSLEKSESLNFVGFLDTAKKSNKSSWFLECCYPRLGILDTKRWPGSPG